MLSFRNIKKDAFYIHRCVVILQNILHNNKVIEVIYDLKFLPTIIEAECSNNIVTGWSRTTSLVGHIIFELHPSDIPMTSETNIDLTSDMN